MSKPAIYTPYFTEPLMLVTHGRAEQPTFQIMTADFPPYVYEEDGQMKGLATEFAQLEKAFEFPFEGKGRMLAFSLDTSEDLVNAFRASFQKREQQGVFEELRAKYLQ